VLVKPLLMNVAVACLLSMVANCKSQLSSAHKGNMGHCGREGSGNGEYLGWNERTRRVTCRYSPSSFGCFFLRPEAVVVESWAARNICQRVV
jgi:hypothetical protein